MRRRISGDNGAMRHIIWDMGGTLINTYPEVDRVLCEAAFGDVEPEHVRHVKIGRAHV